MKLLVCKTSDVNNFYGKRIEIDDLDLAIFKNNDDYFAIDNVCPHQKFRKLYESSCKNYTITCPMHGWEFDLKTGIGNNGKLKLFPLIVEDENIFLVKD